MNTPSDLLTHLRQLAFSVGDPLTHLTDRLDALVADLQEAVTGYAGLAVTVKHAGHPVTLTAVVQDLIDRASTSLGLPLPLLSSSYEEGGRAVFYSTTPDTLLEGLRREALAAGVAVHVAAARLLGP